jgi:type I restriction enzyme S subunit
MDFWQSWDISVRSMGKWELRRLTELAEYLNGYAFAPDDWGAEGLPIIRIEQLKNPNAPADYYAGKLPEKNIIEDGDLIFSWSASLFLRIWRNGRAALNQHLFKVVEKSGVNREFLKSFIEFYLPDLTKASHGSTMQHITRKELEKFSAQFPIDESEQEKIAVVIAALDRVIEQAVALIAKQQRIKTGLMQDLLTKGIDEHGNIRSEASHSFKNSPLGRIPVEWDVKTLGEVVHVIDPNPSHRYPPSVDTGVPMASTENFLGESDFDLSRAEHVPMDVFSEQDARCAFNKNDVVFARKGRIGLARPYGTEKKVFSHTVVLLKPRENDMQARFILWSVRFDGFFDEISKRMNSNSGVPTLGVGFIQAIPISVPRKEERESIVAVLEENESGIQSAVHSLEKLKRVRIGLMHDLLTGERSVTPLLAQAFPQ